MSLIILALLKKRVNGILKGQLTKLGRYGILSIT